MSFWNAAASVIANAANISFQGTQNQKNRQHDVDMANLEADLNERAAKDAWDRSIDQWDAQNQYNEKMLTENREYNSPAAQRQRFQDAGINPAIALGAGGGANVASQPAQASSVPNSPQGKTSAHSTPGKAPVIDPQSYLLAAQARKLDAETEGIKADTDNTSAQTKGYLLDNEFQRMSLKNRLSIVSLDEKLKSMENEFQTQTLDNRVKMVNAELEDLGYRLNVNKKRADNVAGIVNAEIAGHGGALAQAINRVLFGLDLFKDSPSVNFVLDKVDDVKNSKPVQWTGEKIDDFVNWYNRTHK